MTDADHAAQLLSVVVPLYDEAAGLEAFYERLRTVLDGLPRPSEIWFVDDGSRDGTGEAVRGLAERDRRIGLLTLSRNFGHQMALTAGLDHARGDLVISMDGDGQHPPELIPEMLAAAERGFDVVLTRRRRGSEGRFKRWTSAAFYRLMNLLSPTPIVPGAADFRLLARPVVEALGRTRETHRFLRGLVQWVGFRSTVLEFEPGERLAGASKYSRPRMFRFASDALFSFSLVPLRLSVLLGLVLVVLAATELGHTLWLILSGRRGELVPGWTSLIFAILGIGGVQLVMLGILGQYVGMIFEQVKDRPLYLLAGEPLAPGSRSSVVSGFEPGRSGFAPGTAGQPPETPGTPPRDPS